MTTLAKLWVLYIATTAAVIIAVLTHSAWAFALFLACIVFVFAWPRCSECGLAAGLWKPRGQPDQWMFYLPRVLLGWHCARCGNNLAEDKPRRPA